MGKYHIIPFGVDFMQLNRKTEDKIMVDLK